MFSSDVYKIFCLGSIKIEMCVCVCMWCWHSLNWEIEKKIIRGKRRNLVVDGGGIESQI